MQKVSRSETCGENIDSLNYVNGLKNANLRGRITGWKLFAGNTKLWVPRWNLKLI